MIISFRTDVASLYEISASGFAKAKTIGSLAIEATISFETIFPLDKPTKTSAFFIASAKLIEVLCPE